MWTEEGWLYVAGVLDLCSRRILGLAGAEHLETSLPEAALAQAIARLLHHSDRGVQYASERYTALLEKSGITPSMSRRANCYDNAHMERLPAPSGAAVRAKAPPFGYLAPLDSGAPSRPNWSPATASPHAATRGWPSSITSKPSTTACGSTALSAINPLWTTKTT